MNISIAPSILSADFGKLNEEVANIEPYSDLIHIDTMDGHFVPNLTFGAPVVRCIKTKLPLSCHLMVTNPGQHLKSFADAGADSIIFHIETVTDPHSIIQEIRDLGCKPGISIKPKTPASEISELLSDIDLVLVMTVEPGFGGQEFMKDMLPKITELRNHRSDLDIHIDGGMNAETAQAVVEAGANTIVAGSYIFKAEDREKAIESLRKPKV